MKKGRNIIKTKIICSIITNIWYNIFVTLYFFGLKATKLIFCIRG